MVKFEVGDRVKDRDYEGVVIGLFDGGRLVRITRDDGREGFIGPRWQTRPENLTLVSRVEFTLENE